ncbi:hypothetical protein GUITHDRAFT_120898 [Guillardia theta CCMP2712]|uniref:Selenoprotein F/M domain-containing protein n=1 Tax=Guillardia theta (strain CCMP2712) TaxID=905079 RepID=L1I9L3_GUITC|nr:hypothetical protein GUITHDRAFT_120898 [Guillardia theta CCMP2712]EKX32913.1 hypothetical protein GUITHDRAFT_120898 [Guillardia theta CCMP2712]|eukprot:XP_005819893.1 hypothetical protein GUITHDRAFT_120898 [Guillardia theta CCMP2712]
MACGMMTMTMVAAASSSSSSSSSEDQTTSSPSPVKGKFVTCAGCKLNKLPNTKLFVKGASAADVAEIKSYENLEVEYVQGHVPELHIYKDDGSAEPSERISIGELGDDVGRLRDLLKEKGFRRKAEL